MTVSIIAARSENDIIGHGGAIPWHLPADLKHFKRLTTGHTIVMGRKTFDSIGRALPNRRTIVISRNPAFTRDDVTTVRSVDDAIDVAQREPVEPDGDVHVFVVGGAEIYRQALPRTDRMYLTRVHAVIDGDAYFPPFSDGEWERTEAARHAADEKNPYDYTFEIWERKEPEDGRKRERGAGSRSGFRKPCAVSGQPDTGAGAGQAQDTSGSRLTAHGVRWPAHCSLLPAPSTAPAAPDRLGSAPARTRLPSMSTAAP